MVQSVTAESRDGAASRAGLLAVNFIACLLLLVQFLLGMVTNLFVKLPAHHPGSGAKNYFTGVASGVAWVIPHGPGWVAAHSAFGLALVLAAFMNIAISWKSGGRASRITSVLGAVLILGAGFNGASFLNYGQDFSSIIMAGLWALAMTCYLSGLYAVARLVGQ